MKNEELRNVSAERKQNFNKRDNSNDKKKIKKAVVIVGLVLFVLAVLTLIGEVVTNLIKSRGDEVASSRAETTENEISFFPANYSEDIQSDEAYLSLDRRIMFESYGDRFELKESNINNQPPASKMFYYYFRCIMSGDYETYPDFFTTDYRSNPNADIPARFTAQKVYDIGIQLFNIKNRGDNGEMTEIYEVRYSIFENNGTFRRDIRSMETRTLVFEVYTDAFGTAKINSIGYRGNA